MKSIVHALSEARLVGVRRRDGIIVVALQLATTIVEFVGLVSFVPLFQFLNAHGDVSSLARDHQHWRLLEGAFAYAGINLSLAALLLMTFVLLLVRQALSLARTLFEHSRRESATARIRARLFERFLVARTDAQDRMSSGGIVADMTQNVASAMLHIFGRFALATQIVVGAVYAAGMLLVSPPMTALLLAVVGLAGLVAAPQILKARRLGKDLVVANRNVAEFIIERLKLARLVRLARMEEPEAASVRALAEAQRVALFGAWRLVSVTDALLETIAIAAGLLVVYLAVAWVGVGIELVGIFLAMLLRLLPLVQQIAKTKQSTDSTRAAFDSVVARLKEFDENTEVSAGTRSFAGPEQELALRDVSYTYASRPNAPVLRGIRLTMPARRMTAIVGPSGSGKSTLIDLLPRLRSPDTGDIRIDDVDIADIDLASLRRGIAYLSQSPLIFNVPLRDHIAYGAPDASDADIERAARLAGAHDFIMALPQGYRTLAGESGKTLSGGQRQRLDLARALLSRAPILILDEPTANLDAQSERAFREALDRIRAETSTTIIVVAHRLATVETADQIVVLEGGRVTGAGTHSELIRTNAWYRTAFAQPEPLVAAQ